MCAKQIPYTMGKQVSFDVHASACGLSCTSLSRMQISGLLSTNSLCRSAASSCARMRDVSPGDMILTTYYRSTVMPNRW